MVAVGDVSEQGSDDLLVFRGGGEVYRLVHVVRGRVIALRQPVLENLYLGRSGLGSHTHGQRRYTVADEVVLITAHEKIAQRLGIGLNLHAERLRDLAYAISQIGIVETEYGEQLQGHDRQKHVDVNVGDDGLGRDRGMSGEILRAEQTLFFSGDQDQENRTAQFGRILLEACGHIQCQGAAGAVVHGSVVNAVAVDGFSDADVIEVGGEHYVFIFKSGIAALEFGDEVSRFDFGDIHSGIRGERNGEREVGQ